MVYKFLAAIVLFSLSTLGDCSPVKAESGIYINAGKVSAANVSIEAKKKKKTKKKKKKASSKRIKFADLSNSSLVGLALKGNGSSRLSAKAVDQTLVGVTQDGSFTPVVTGGTPVVSKMLTSSSGKAYILFESKTDLLTSQANSDTGCLLAEVPATGGYPTCIDDALVSIDFSQTGANKPIQFDGAGNIYYRGSTTTGRVLRKYDSTSKAITDLITGNVYLLDFLVTSDGSVVISGETFPTFSAWIRQVTPVGGLKTIVSGGTASLYLFPDSNIYMPINNVDYYGVLRALTSTWQLDSNYWISGDGYITGSRGTNFSTNTLCVSPNNTTYSAFCGSYGSSLREMYTTTDNKVYGYAVSTTTDLMQVYPTVEFKPSMLKKISLLRGFGNYLALAGTDQSGINSLTIYNTADDTEERVIDSANEVEIYRIIYVPGSNVLMFDGLRFSDNKYVIGQVDLDTLAVTMTATGQTSKLADFQPL